MCHCEDSYLSVSNERSRAGGHFFLSLPPGYKQNGAIHAISHVICNVMASATENEITALYIKAREAVTICNILVELGHKQQPTLMQMDRETADGLLQQKMQSKRTKAMDMRFHWLSDRQQQQQLNICW